MEKLVAVHPEKASNSKFLGSLEISSHILSKDLKIPQTRIS